MSRRLLACNWQDRARTMSDDWIDIAVSISYAGNLERTAACGCAPSARVIGTGRCETESRVPCGYVSCDRLMRRTLRCSALLAICSWTLGTISPRNRVFVKFQKSIGFIYLRARPEPPCHAPCSPKAESQKSYQVDSADAQRTPTGIPLIHYRG